jgi:hypothetical protein
MMTVAVLVKPMASRNASDTSPTVVTFLPQGAQGSHRKADRRPASGFKARALR